MDQILKNPGFQHILEMILLNVDYKDLLACEMINKSCQEILENPIFLKKLTLRGMSKKNQDDWYDAIQITENRTVYGKKLNLVPYLNKIMKNGHVSDIPCYIDEKILNEIESERLNNVHDIFLCKYGYIPGCRYYHWKSEICNIGPGKIQVYSILMENFRHYSAMDLILESVQPQSMRRVWRDNVGMVKEFQPMYKGPEIVEVLLPFINDSPAHIVREAIETAEKYGHHEAARILKSYKKQ